MTLNLSKKQKSIFDFLVEYVTANGIYPTVREIGDHFNLAASTVFEHLQNLIAKGYLKKSSDSERAFGLVENSVSFDASVSLPLTGLIAAGQPIEAIEQPETMAIPAFLVGKPQSSFVLQVKGDSMVDEGILDGDYVVVEKNPAPRNGQIVVALLENQFATLKKIYKERGRIRLQPANSKMRPIFVKEASVQGVVKAVFRKY